MCSVHLICLRTWLQRKENVKNAGPNVTTYTWRAYHCELCKSEYQDRVYSEREDRWYWLLDINRPDSNYMILESI